MAVKVLVLLTILGYVVGMPDQAKNIHESLDATDDDSTEWVAVGELVHDYNVTNTNEEEVLNDANDPMVLSDDLCHSLIGIYTDMPEHFNSTLSELKLDQPSLRYPRCLRTRFGFYYLCRGPRFTNYRGFRYCCSNPAMSPLLTRNINFIRCRCAFL
ncbi:uncharacterized protein [Palaemon carinicauda]|uniref:uncharacterized protein n=1 Tax=Palaemon carinicauda TaxID=392227 RepID=UPI0035B674F3